MALQDKAMLVSLNISVWSARKRDKRETSDLTIRKGARDGSVLVTKALVAKEALKAINAAATGARQDHYRLTLPWLQSGPSILASGVYFDYTAAMQTWRAQFDAAVVDFRDNYDSYIQQAQTDLNGLFDWADYPSPAKVARSFGFDVVTMPLPASADWRVTLTDTEEARIKADITDRLQSAEQAAMQDLWHRLFDGVTALHDKLGSYSGKREGSFRDSLVGNLVDLVDLLPKLNISDDANLTSMADQVRGMLLAHEAQTLRDSDTLRDRVIADADAILANMAGYLGGD